VGGRHFAFHRVQTGEASIVEGNLLRMTIPILNVPVVPVTINVRLEGKVRSSRTTFLVRVCADGQVTFDQEIISEGSFSVPVPLAQNLSIWVDAPQYIASQVLFPTSMPSRSIDIMLNCGDVNDDGIVDLNDLARPADVNLDGYVNDQDLFLINQNMGLVQEEAACSPYVMNSTGYSVVFGQKAAVYREAGIEPGRLFSAAQGKISDDAIWIQITKVSDPCSASSGFSSSDHGTVISSTRTTSQITARETSDEDSGLKIFPNPARSAVQVVSPTIMTTVTLINEHGTVVIEETPDAASTKLDLGNIQPGQYFVVTTGDGLRSQKAKLTVIK